jgi:hypothetical protein
MAEDSVNDPADHHEPRDPALDDTVADEEVLEPVEPLTAPPESSPPPPPPPSRFHPPPPVFRERPSAPSPNGSPTRTAAPVLRDPRPEPSPQRASQRRWKEDLGDTPGLEDSRLAGIRSGDVERLALDDIYDRPEELAASSVADYDPEAGRTNVAIKIQAVRQVVRSATSTPFGRLMLAIPIALAGLTLTIMALTMQDLWMWIAAAIVTPLGGWLLYVRYQTWLGHKRYMYRLLESLGEDVSDFDNTRAYRRVGRSMNRRQIR